MPRHVAFMCLRGGSPKPLLEVDRFARERGLDERDTALARHLVGTEVRRRATLRAVVAGFTHQKPKADLATLLRLGIAQLLFFDRVPAHAAVSETVRATTDFLGLSKGKIVNGVMRSVLRSLREGRSGDPTADLVDRELHFDGPVFRDPEQHPHLWAEDALSVPSALHKKWSQRHGIEGANELARLALEEAPLSIRFTGKDDGASRAELAGKGVELLPTGHGRVWLSPSGFSGAVLRSDAFAAGAITIQGEHALRAAELAGNVEGKRVLDLCAAPGGKSAVLAAGAPALHVALDLSPARLGKLEGLRRLGVAVPALAAMDGTSALAPDATFDLALLDAPCSNTGVLAQRPAARWRYGPKSQSSLVEIQGRLLREAAARVAPGGALVYSTCSLEPEENERQVTRFLREAPAGDWERDGTVESRPASIERGGPVDGGFAARLVRVAR